MKSGDQNWYSILFSLLPICVECKVVLCVIDVYYNNLNIKPVPENNDTVYRFCSDVFETEIDQDN